MSDQASAGSGIKVCDAAAAVRVRLAPRLAFLLFLCAVWLILGRYYGIRHDALGYMLETVARLRPYPLADDIFLRFRSQEEFTVFPALCAPIVGWLGVDIGGAGLTFIFFLCWIAVSWLLARRLQGAALAWLSIALLLVIPRWYGAYHIFRIAEPFFNARAPAEVLALGAVLASLHRKWLVSAALLLAAGFVHPIMAMPAALVVVLMALPVDSPRRALLLGTCMFLGAIVGSLALSHDPTYMTPQWLHATRLRSPFLFLDQWEPVDWELATITLVTVFVATTTAFDSATRRLATACLVVAVTGVALTLVSSELLPVKLLVQGQPWRWLWTSRFLSILLLPAIFHAAWRAGPVGRSAALLLASAWLIADTGSTGDIPPFGVGGLLAISAALAWQLRQAESARALRYFPVFGWCSLALVVVQTVHSAANTLEITDSYGLDPLWIQVLQGLMKQLGIAIPIVVAAWWVCFKGWTAPRAGLLVGAALIAATCAGPVALLWWTSPRYGEERREQFSSWRAAIPSDREVLWISAPSATWFLLDRKSYLTVSQSAGMVFSEDTAREIARRSRVLEPLVDPGYWILDPLALTRKPLTALTPAILNQICRDPQLGFVVSDERLDSFVASAEWPIKSKFVFLYDCRRIPASEHG